MSCRTIETKDIHTDQEQFEALWDAVHKTRSTSQSVRVDLQSITNLLMDHSRLFEAVFGSNIQSQHNRRTS